MAQDKKSNGAGQSMAAAVKFDAHAGVE